MKTTIIVILLIVLAGAGGYLYRDKAEDKKGDTTTIEFSGKVKGIDNVESVVATDISWDFENLGDDSTGIPNTKVSVKIQNNVYTLGTYQGSCAVRSDLNANELSGVLCWYAGFGDELGVYKENGRIIIKHRQVEEGTAEAAGQNGEFKALLTL